MKMDILREFFNGICLVDTWRRVNVYKTSIRRQRRLIDVETTSFVYWLPVKVKRGG